MNEGIVSYRMMRNAVAAKALARVGLLKPAFRAYETVASIRGSRASAAADGLPVPPARLRHGVICSPSLDRFVESGERGYATIMATLDRNHVPFPASLLEFGCGCGRLLRHWQHAPVSAHGVDIRRDMVTWCSRHLRFATLSRIAESPPLPYSDATFDLVYAMSVFIHVRPKLQQPWIAELARVTRPGGHVLVSTHGAGYLDEMTVAERERYDRGEFVFRLPEAAGTNLSAGFHPPGYLPRIASPLELVEHAEAAALDTREDVYLFRRL